MIDPCRYQCPKSTAWLPPKKNYATFSPWFPCVPHGFIAALLVLASLPVHPENPDAIAATVVVSSWQDRGHLVCSRSYLDGNGKWDS